MDKNELVNKINRYLDENPFTEEEILTWKDKVSKMNETQLSRLFLLLQEKIKILTNTNQLFFNIADKLNDYGNQRETIIPKQVYISDMSFEDLLVIMKEHLVTFLQNNEIDLVNQLDNYFFISKVTGEAKVVEKFDILVNAILTNKEKVGRITVGEWLNTYNKFNDSFTRKSIDRINFINNDKAANLLNQDQKNVLMKLLKIFDFLINPAETFLDKQAIYQGKSKIPDSIGVPKTVEEKKIEELKEMLPQEEGVGKMAIEEGISDTQKIDELKTIANRYKDNSLQRRAIEEEIRKLENK